MLVKANNGAGRKVNDYYQRYGLQRIFQGQIYQTLPSKIEGRSFCAEIVRLKMDTLAICQPVASELKK